MLTITRRAKQYLIVVFAVGCLAPSAFADSTLTLVDPGSNAPYDLVYVGPYQISIDGANPVEAICLDYQYNTEVTSPPWSTTVSGVGSDTTLQEQAYLAGQLLQATDPTVAAEYQYAIWDLSPVNADLITPAQPALSTVLTNIGNGSDLNVDPSVSGAAFAAAVAQDVVNAQKFVGANPTYDYSGVSVYSPDNPAQPADTAMQRFMTVPAGTLGVTSVPEPPVFSVLGVDFSAVGALIFLFRRRINAA